MTNRWFRHLLRSTNPVWFWLLGITIVAVNAYLAVRFGWWTKWDVQRDVVSWIYSVTKG